MLSNDIKSLQPDTGIPAALLSRKGKIISDLFVHRRAENALLEMEPQRVGPISEALARYIVTEDVELKDVSGQDAIITVAGPHSPELMSELIGSSVSELLPFQSKHGKINDLALTVVSVRHGPGPGFDVYVEADRAAELLRRLSEIDGRGSIGLAGYRTMDTRRIEIGERLFGIDMDDSHLLLEAGLLSAVSFNKGCYIGQEYVARLANRGHLNRKLVGLRLTETVGPERDEEIVGDDRSIGRVTSATLSPALECPIALGYVHRDFFDVGTAVTVKNNRGDLPAMVTDLPFLE
jgi:folate-binding protein YgfZ